MSSFKRSQRKYVKKAYLVRNWREYEVGLRGESYGLDCTHRWQAPKLGCTQAEEQETWSSAQVLGSRDRDGRHGEHGVWSDVQADGGVSAIVVGAAESGQ